ncbi:uncharacterized protein BCN122_III0158 [Burkholderia cenocepacia]|jgi:hypothetical protein|nr:uncharacterized protein BCN122_III0158 [Burkholderia cenocepacia]
MAGPNRLNRHSGRASSLPFRLLAVLRETGSPVADAGSDS